MSADNRSGSGIRRVLMTTDTIGGVWTYSLALARALGAYGVEISLATMGAPLTEAQTQAAAAIPNLEIYPSIYRLEWMTDPWADVARAGEWLLPLENEIEPDIVHLNGYALGDRPWRAPHIVVGHSCVLSWWRAVKGEDAPEEWDRYRVAVGRGLRAADFVVAPSRAMLSELECLYGPLGDRAVVPNGCEARSEKLPRKEPIVLAAGRAWDEGKNFAMLDRAGPAVEWPICVAGDRQADMANVRMLGLLDPSELAHWFQRASVYCLPALYEPFGLSVLEAAQAGCALVLGDIPSLRENWDGAAVFVSPRDEDALTAALQSLIADDQRRDELAAEATRRSRQFTAERMAGGYMEIYRQLAGRRVEVACAS